MRKVGILEKAKTPYRPPLFEYIGNYVDLTVYYASEGEPHRRWKTDHENQSYKEREPTNRGVNRVNINPGLLKDVLKQGYDEFVISSGTYQLLNSKFIAKISELQDTKLTVWSERIQTKWSKGYGRPYRIRMGKKVTKPLFQSIRRRMYEQADHTIAYSRLAAQTAIVEGTSKNNYTIAPQWYPPEILIEPQIDQVTNSYRILYVGELSHRKGTDVLLEAAQRFPPSDHIEFIIAGIGELQGLVKKYSNKHENINYIGYINERRKSEEYNKADLFVLPSRHDPWGLVINEAYLFNTPAITTSATGAEMIVPDNLTISPNSDDELYEAIRSARSQPPISPEQPTLEEMGDPLIKPIEERLTETNLTEYI